jgi:hypothetical protein
LNIEADALTFLQTFEAAILDSAEMHEHVAPALGRYESEAFALIEPFHFSLHRRLILLSQIFSRWINATA